MSGHSKWHNIRLRKGAQDLRKGKIFGKVAREIMVAVREGGSGDPDANSRLRTALDHARRVEMPADNIKRAISKGLGNDGGGANFETLTYEGYGPGGVAVMVHVLTDNRNRTVAELRSTFSRNGGNLGEANCVAWLFDQKGVIVVPREAAEEDAILEVALEAGAEDMQSDESSFEIRTAAADLETVTKALEARGIRYDSAEITMLPQTKVTPSEKQAQQMLRMMDALEDLDDVQQVYANFDIPESIMEAVAA
jgi:YebC/PmpR family DNA-binding regulatory protein